MMKIRKFGSATILVELEGIKVLCDPWLTDGAYYGSWCNYPPINLEKCDFSDVDYVYVSHIHPDHFDPKTMELISKSTPVLIHSYHQKFLKANIERFGFDVIELENGVPYPLFQKAKISIFAADNCDPSICGHLFGCVNSEIKGSMQLDSLCVIEDDKHVLVNTNDCPFEIAEQALRTVKKKYPIIDFALIGYTSASLFPHCMMDYTEAEMELGKQHARNRGLNTGLNTLKLLQPRYYMPFAGTYILGGSNFKKNSNLPIPEIQDAVEYFEQGLTQERLVAQSVLLNFSEAFCLEDEEASAPYEPISKTGRSEYINDIASHFKYSFEDDPWPSEEELVNLFKDAVSRLERKQLEVSLIEDLNLVFDISASSYVVINLIDTEPKVVQNFDALSNYHRFKLDPRLLKRALQGPRYAIWNNIEIGALLDFSRKPDIYRMDVHTLVNALHV